jgi:hypothetical protein
MAQIEDESEEDCCQSKIRSDPQAGGRLSPRGIRSATRGAADTRVNHRKRRKPQKPDDLAPTAHEIPQMPKKACEPR